MEFFFPAFTMAHLLAKHAKFSSEDPKNCFKNIIVSLEKSFAFQAEILHSLADHVATKNVFKLDYPCLPRKVANTQKLDWLC